MLMTAACAQAPNFSQEAPSASRQASIDPERMAFAISQAKALRATGQRVWCVPFARNASGIELRGNAGTWWNAAAGTQYQRSHDPKVGAVMVFSAKRSMPMGHVAVVSKILSDREILIDHANWKRNQISRGMKVIDVSKKGDWSAVKVETNPGQTGSVYPIAGFISHPSKAI